jgi:hypothetical protein
MKEPTFTPAATGANSEATNTTGQRDDGPSLEWIAAFKAQATEEMMDDIVAYVVKRASWIHHQKGDNAKGFVREMVVDVLGDTFARTVVWEPTRCPLALHIKSVIRSRLAHELERREDFEHVEVGVMREEVVHDAMVKSDKPSLAPTKRLSVYVKQFVDQLRELAADDVPVTKLIDLHLQDITERRHVCHMTGMSPSAYHNAFRRLQRLADKIPATLRDAAIDSLEGDL